MLFLRFCIIVHSFYCLFHLFHLQISLLWLSVSFNGTGSVTFRVIGSREPTKLTQVTASLSLAVPSTAMVNMGGGEEVWVVEEERDEVREEVRE